MRQKRRKDRGNLLADINVTPLVDVVLVLLIIFMVTAPMLQMGIDVDLPRVKSNNMDVTEEKVVLTVKNSRDIFINKDKTNITSLSARLETIMDSRIEREVFMRADKNVPYGFVVEVMSEIRKAGIDKLGMITEPPENAD